MLHVVQFPSFCLELCALGGQEQGLVLWGQTGSASMFLIAFGGGWGSRNCLYFGAFLSLSYLEVMFYLACLLPAICVSCALFVMPMLLQYACHVTREKKSARQITVLAYLHSP